MPLFEFRCRKCEKKFELLIGIKSDEPAFICPYCKSSDIKKLISRFRPVKSEEARLEELADPRNFAGLDENDPRSIVKWAKKLGKALGEDCSDEIEALAAEEIENYEKSQKKGLDFTANENNEESACEESSYCTSDACTNTEDLN